MNWQTYHSYRVFDEFLQRFVLERKSYITTHEQTLDFDAAFDDIHQRFVEGADESEDTFGEKVNRQFGNAELNTQIVFTNVEYMWCLPSSNITGPRKHRYATRWFTPEKVQQGDKYFIFITLCPNCHYLAHYLLRQKGGGKYKVEANLVQKLKGLRML